MTFRQPRLTALFVGRVGELGSLYHNVHVVVLAMGSAWPSRGQGVNEYCQYCPRRFDTYPGKPGACRSDGVSEAPILIVGMSPGEHELNSVPFIGKAGSVLWGAAR